MQKREAREPLYSHSRVQVRIDPSHATKFSIVAVDTGIVKIIVRLAVTLGYSSLFVRHRVSCGVDGFSEACCCHFDVHLTISPSKMTLSICQVVGVGAKDLVCYIRIE